MPVFNLDVLIRIFKPIGIVLAIFAALSVFGIVFNNLPWIFLTYFFKVILVLLSYLSFFWDLDSLIIVLTLSLNILQAYWLFLSVMFVIHKFKHNKI